MSTKATTSAGSTIHFEIGKRQWAPLRKSIGATIQQRRRHMGLTHQQLADAMGRYVGTSIRYCSGRSTPSLRDLYAIAKVLKCEPGLLLPVLE